MSESEQPFSISYEALRLMKVAYAKALYGSDGPIHNDDYLYYILTEIRQDPGLGRKAKRRMQVFVVVLRYLQLEAISDSPEEFRELVQKEKDLCS